MWIGDDCSSDLFRDHRLLQFVLDLCDGRNSAPVDASTRFWIRRRRLWHAEQIVISIQHRGRRVSNARIGRGQLSEIHDLVVESQAERPQRIVQIVEHVRRVHAAVSRDEHEIRSHRSRATRQRRRFRDLFAAGTGQQAAARDRESSSIHELLSRHIHVPRRATGFLVEVAGHDTKYAIQPRIPSIVRPKRHRHAYAIPLRTAQAVPFPSNANANAVIGVEIPARTQACRDSSDLGRRLRARSEGTGNCLRRRTSGAGHECARPLRFRRRCPGRCPRVLRRHNCIGRRFRRELHGGIE